MGNAYQPPPQQPPPGWGPQQPYVQPPQKEPWYYQPPWMALSLLFCFPVGLLFLWGSPKASKPVKIGATAFIVLLLVIGSAGSKQTSPPTTAAPPTVNPVPVRTAAPPKQPDLSVSANTLFNEYQANEVAADEKFKGKRLLVSGKVASIDKGVMGGLHLRLATSNEFMSVMCSMEDSEKATVAKLQKGESVNVLCEGNGMVIGSPSLDDCVFR